MFNPYISVLRSAAFCCLIVGAFTTFGGYQTLQNVNRQDGSWEEVSFRDFRVGNHENGLQFHLTDVRHADGYTALDNHKVPGELRSAYIPLYASDQPEDQGAGIQVIATAFNLSAEELEDLFLANPLPVQASETNKIPPLMRELSEIYPNINWDAVRVVNLSDSLPSLTSAFVMLGIGLALLASGIAAGIASFSLFWRRRSATHADYADQVADSEQEQGRNSEINSSQLAVRVRSIANIFTSISPFLIFGNAALAIAARNGMLDSDTVMPILCVTGPIWLLSACSALAVNFFFGPAFSIERKSESEIPQAALTKLKTETIAFEQLGFRFLGYAQTHYFGKKWNAFLISPTGKRVVELSGDTKSVSANMLGVTDNGLVYCNGKGQVDAEVTGTEVGVPLLASLKTNRTPHETMKNLEDFERSLAGTGSRLLVIRPSDVFHLMHYESIATGWWTYRSSARFSKPESLPSLLELTENIDGVDYFNFRRASALDNAFENDSVATHAQDEPTVEAPQPVPIATAGGEELYSARFFNSQMVD